MHRQDYHATLILMLGFAAATLTGFVREAALAYQFGAGRETDIYLVAFTLPEIVFVALPIILWPSFIPLFIECRQHAGEEGAWRFGLRVAGALLMALLGGTVLVALVTPLSLRWLSPGFDPQERAQALRAAYVMLPAISFMGGGALAGAVLQVYRRFARPALATATYNLTFVAVLLGFPVALGVSSSAQWAAWGVTLGAAAALALQLSLLWRYRPMSLRPALVRWGSAQLPAGVRDVARLAGPFAAAYFVHHIILFVDRALATTLGYGSVATIHYAYRLALVVGQLSGVAVSTALFPRIAEQVADNDLPGLRSSLAGALYFVCAVGLPAAAGLILLRVPLVQVLFERGAFEQGATTAVTQVLLWYALAVLADALCQPLWRVLYAWRSTRAVLGINSLQTGIRILCNLALIHDFGYNGLAISAFLGLSIQAIVLGLAVRRRLGTYLPEGWWRRVVWVVFATAVALVVASLLAKQLPNVPALALLVISGTSGCVAYLGILLFLRKRAL